jgi:putative two-component system response regulator
MLERLAVTAELREESSGEHAYRVARLASLLAREIGEDEATCAMIEVATRLHDVGKISVPDGILLKQGSLNPAEIKVMQSHCTVGAELLSESHVPQLRLAEEIARFHHEWWDGSGYPFGIGGSAIPRPARIVALADVFDALTHRRPYKPAWSVERALDYIGERSGVQFDPDLSGAFVSLVERLRHEVEDLDTYLAEAARESSFLVARKRIARALAQPMSEEVQPGPVGPAAAAAAAAADPDAPAGAV